MSITECCVGSIDAGLKSSTTRIHDTNRLACEVSKYASLADNVCQKPAKSEAQGQRFGTKNAKKLRHRKRFELVTQKHMRAH